MKEDEVKQSILEYANRIGMNGFEPMKLKRELSKGGVRNDYLYIEQCLAELIKDNHVKQPYLTYPFQCYLSDSGLEILENGGYEKYRIEKEQKKAAEMAEVERLKKLDETLKTESLKALKRPKPIITLDRVIVFFVGVLVPFSIWYIGDRNKSSTESKPIQAKQMPIDISKKNLSKPIARDSVPSKIQR